MSEEQRAQKRFDVAAPAVVEAPDDGGAGGSKYLNLFTKDVSAGGAFLYTDSPLPEGTELVIDLVLLTDEIKKMQGDQVLIKFQGSVVRCESEGMAVCFNKRYNILPL